MAPKRKNNNKKRRPKTDQPTPNRSPETSPSRVINPIARSPSATTPTPDDHHSTPTKPKNNSSDHHPGSTSTHSDKLQSSITDSTESHDEPDHHPSIKSPETAPSATDPDPLTQRSVNLNHKSENHRSADTSAQSDTPAKSTTKLQTGKHTPEIHRSQDTNGASSENSADPKVHSKHETRKASDKSNSQNHPVDGKSPNHAQRSNDRVLKEIHDHNNPQNGLPKQPDQTKSKDDKSDPAPPKSPEDDTKSSNQNSNSVKKPIKHVKFTHNLKNEQSQNATTQENQSSQQNHRHQASHETGNIKSGAKNKQNAIRREMSGAADQFDFDAQQRQHAGPGGGMVKKPRHQQTSSVNSTGSHSTSGEPNEGLSDSSPSESRDEPHDRKKDSMGFQHAQQCLQSITRTQKLHQPTELDPDLLQIYLSYFDQNQDGLLDPLDTWRAFRLLGFGFLIATLSAVTLHALMIPLIWIGSGLLPDTLGRSPLPINHHFLDSIRNHINITQNGHPSRKCDYPDKIGPLAIWKETCEHFGNRVTDPLGWLRVVFGWIIVVALTWPSDLTVNKDLIDGVYNGEILFMVAQDSAY